MSSDAPNDDAAPRALVAGHGDFAAGAVSAGAQICGRAATFVTLTNRDLGPGEIEQRLRDELAAAGVRVIFTDLPAGSCTIANLDPVVAACAVTSQLPGGQIATQFLTTPGPAPKIVAVTGGTGSYRNVRGSARLVEHGDGTGTLTFHLLG